MKYHLFSDPVCQNISINDYNKSTYGPNGCWYVVGRITEGNQSTVDTVCGDDDVIPPGALITYKDFVGQLLGATESKSIRKILILRRIMYTLTSMNAFAFNNQ